MNLGNLLTASALRNPHKAALITGVGRNLRDHRRIWVEKNEKALRSVPRSRTARFWKTAAALCLTSFAYRDLVSDI